MCDNLPRLLQSYLRMLLKVRLRLSFSLRTNPFQELNNKIKLKFKSRLEALFTLLLPLREEDEYKTLCQILKQRPKEIYNIIFKLCITSSYKQTFFLLERILQQCRVSREQEIFLKEDNSPNKNLKLLLDLVRLLSCSKIKDVKLDNNQKYTFACLSTSKRLYLV